VRSNERAQLGYKPEKVVEQLHRGRCYECDVLRSNLARLVADYLATMDSDLRAVYFYNPEYAVGDYQSPFEERFKSSALYLLAWSRTSGSIPSDTIEGLTEAFDHERTALVCEDASTLCFSLDGQSSATPD
jgi:hypothetical protein